VCFAFYGRRARGVGGGGGGGGGCGCCFLSRSLVVRQQLSCVCIRDCGQRWSGALVLVLVPAPVATLLGREIWEEENDDDEEEEEEEEEDNEGG